MTFSSKSLSLLLLASLASSSVVTCFTPAVTISRSHENPSASTRFMSESPTTENKAVAVAQLAVPLTWDEMIRQAASAMKDAAAAGKTRQIVRILLPRDASNADFGKYLEASTTEEMNNAEVVLCPTDESWQGGIMQLYRAAAPTAERILRKLTENSASGLPPRITEDRSCDESGVDGVGLFRTDDGSVQCYVQPTQEIVDVFVGAAESAKDTQIVALINPQWRQVDDALDTASQGTGFFSTVASFLGGKGGTLKRLREAGFTPVYTVEGYVCRGANVRLLQVIDSPWNVFCERDDRETFVSVGTSVQRPTYQEVDEMLSKAEIGFKYARDMGMQPKL